MRIARTLALVAPVALSPAASGSQVPDLLRPAHPVAPTAGTEARSGSALTADPSCPAYVNPVIKRKPAPEAMAYARALTTQADSAYYAFERGGDGAARVGAFAAAFDSARPPSAYAAVHRPLVAAVAGLATTAARAGAAPAPERAAAEARYREARHRATCRFVAQGVVVPPVRAPR